MRRAVPGLVLVVCAALPASARADILPSPCTVESMQAYLDERCLVCEASEYAPERCRDAYAATGLVQRCAGSPQGSTRGLSMWGEVWCIPRGNPPDAVLPPALPPVERDGLLPKLPPGGLPHPPTLAPPHAPRDEMPALPTLPGAPEPPAPASPPPPASAGCGCATTAPSAAWLLACAPLLARRRRR